MPYRTREMKEKGIPGKPGRPIGTGHYPYREDEEREEICKLIEKGTTNEEIALLTGWSALEVRDTRARFYPTKGLAERYLKANALRMAIRIVEESDVSETIDILSRPNIGVLAPAIKPGSNPNIGIFTNISLDSLGSIQTSPAVKGLGTGSVVDAVVEPQAGTHETRPAPAPILKRQLPQSKRGKNKPVFPA
jgi:hypothetical protein